MSTTPLSPVAQATLAEFPERPTKKQLLDSLFTALEDIGLIYDSVEKCDEDLLLDSATLDKLAATATRVTVLRQVFASIAYLAHHKTEITKRLILPG